MIAASLIPLVLFGSAFEDTFTQAVKAYQDDSYEEAARLFETLVDQGVVDAEVFYNLGNAYYRVGELGQAIANYERALQLNPRMADAEENLAQAISQTERRLSRPPPPRLEQSLLFWHHSITPGMAFGLTAICWTGTWLLLALRKLRPVRYLRRAAVVLAVLAVLFAASAWIKAHPQAMAVASADRVPVHYGTSTSETVHFELYEGDRVRVDRHQGNWIRVETADGQRGWAQRDYMTLVGPPYETPLVARAEQEASP